MDLRAMAFSDLVYLVFDRTGVRIDINLQSLSFSVWLLSPSYNVIARHEFPLEGERVAHRFGGHVEMHNLSRFQIIGLPVRKAGMVWVTRVREGEPGLGHGL